MTLMRDGSTVQDSRLGRLTGHTDPRSLSLYGVAERLEKIRREGAVRRGKTWRRGNQLDQGTEGACVGFSLGTERYANPVPVAVDAAACHAVYRRAQELDPWPETGPNGEDGTSVLAGCKAAVEAGWFDRYEWCANVDEVVDILTLPTKGKGDRYGPVVIGMAWYADMINPDTEGFIEPTGAVVGGHAICIRGVRLAQLGEPVFVLTNTWGSDYGNQGECYLTASGLQTAMGSEFEAVVPVHRRRI